MSTSKQRRIVVEERGEVLITEGVRATMSADEIDTALERHCAGDWGDLGAEEKASNDRALETGCGALVSRYCALCGLAFFVLTEGDRSVTTVFLPLEY